jgi:ATP-dependent exoDNAse (exonuclease V) alpha subunit
MATLAETQLTQDQAKLLNWFIENVKESGSQRVLTIAGSAGTGKTFVLQKLIEYLKERFGHNYKVGVAAPTNKAVRVLAEKLKSGSFVLDYDLYSDGKRFDPRRVYIGTIHKFLRLVPNSNDPEVDDAELQFDLNSCNKQDRPIQKMDAIFVDEASMVSKGYVDAILDSVGNDSLVVFVGDEFQLFPVEKTLELSPVFSFKNKFSLSQVVRYDGEILRVASQIRERMEDGLTHRPFYFRDCSFDDFTVVRDTSGYLGTDWYRSLLQYAKEQYKSGLHPDYVRALVYRRRTRQQLNNFLRKDLFGMESSGFVAGEWLFTHAQCSSYYSLSDRVALLRARDSGSTVYPYLRDKMIERIVRIENARDLKVGESEIHQCLIPSPTQDLDDVWPKLNQEFSLLTVSSSYVGDLRVAILSEKQLAMLARNKQEIVNFVNKVGYHSQTISDFLKHLNRCFNVSETPIKRVDKEEQSLTYSTNITYLLSSKMQSGLVLTVHQSQGSTVDHAFILYNDFFTHPSMNMSKKDAAELLYRLTYTAVTRAKKSARVFSKV